MTVLMILAYAAICVVVFKLLRVPLNKWTVTTAGIGGVVIVGGILTAMNYNHPFTTDGRIYFYTTQIVPTVKGHVTEIAVKPNVPLKQGDVLLGIDPRPYQFIVDQKRAALAEAEQGVKQLKTSLDQATASVDKVKSQLELAQLTYDRQVELLDKKVVAQATVDNATRNLETAKQSVAEAEAAAERARLAYSSDIGGVNTTVARLEADLQNAEFDLSETTLKAPTNGYVTQLFLRPGMTASPSTPTMVFIHNDDVAFSASFSQNTLQRLRAGDEAEIAFDGIPGHIVKGKVGVVSDAIAQGQLQAGGNLLNPEDRSKVTGRALTRIDITDDLAAYQLPPGATGQVAVYTDNMRPVAAIRRILLRMKSWMNYVLP